MAILELLTTNWLNPSPCKKDNAWDKIEYTYSLYECCFLAILFSFSMHDHISKEISDYIVWTRSHMWCVLGFCSCHILWVWTWPVWSARSEQGFCEWSRFYVRGYENPLWVIERLTTLGSQHFWWQKKQSAFLDTI